MSGLWENIKIWLFDNWKMSATGLVAGFVILLGKYGVVLSQGAQDTLETWVFSAGIALLGLLGADAKKNNQQ